MCDCSTLYIGRCVGKPNTVLSLCWVGSTFVGVHMDDGDDLFGLFCEGVLHDGLEGVVLQVTDDMVSV